MQRNLAPAHHRGSNVSVGKIAEYELGASRNLVEGTGAEVVDDTHVATASKQRGRQMRSDKSRAARDPKHRRLP
jgi:hypothetical protein